MREKAEANDGCDVKVRSRGDGDVSPPTHVIADDNKRPSTFRNLRRFNE